MFSNVAVWRFQLFNYVWRTLNSCNSISSIKLNLSLCLIQVIILILWSVLNCLSILLIFENFSENTFCALWLIYSICCSDSLNVHSSSMHGIELVFHLNSSSWGSLTSSSIWINLVLSNWRSSYVQFSRLAWNQILSLIAARLNYKTLVCIWNCITSTNRTGINRLPSIFSSLNLALTSNLNYTVYQRLILNGSWNIHSIFSLSIFLSYKSQWSLANIDWMIGIIWYSRRRVIWSWRRAILVQKIEIYILNKSCLLLAHVTWTSGGLNRSKPSC
jgi:hypothetical protein